MRYKVVGCSRRGSNVHGTAAGEVITTAGAIGNDGVGNVEGASVEDAATVFGG